MSQKLLTYTIKSQLLGSVPDPTFLLGSLPTNFILTLYTMLPAHTIFLTYSYSPLSKISLSCIIIHLISILPLRPGSKPQFQEVILDPSQAILDGSPVIIFMFLLYFGIAYYQLQKLSTYGLAIPTRLWALFFRLRMESPYFKHNVLLVADIPQMFAEWVREYGVSNPVSCWISRTDGIKG